MSEIFISRLIIECIEPNSCINIELYIETKNNRHECIHDGNNWGCYTGTLSPILSYPTPTPTFKFAIENIPSITNQPTNNLSKYLPWIISVNIAVICILILCGITCFVIYKYKNKSKENVVDTIIINESSHNNKISNNNINKNDPNQKNNHQKADTFGSKSMESLYDKNLIISPHTKGTTKDNPIINDIIKQNSNKKTGNKYGEDSPAILSPSIIIKNEGIITVENASIMNNINATNNIGVILEHYSDDDISIITDDKHAIN